MQSPSIWRPPRLTRIRGISSQLQHSQPRGAEIFQPKRKPGKSRWFHRLAGARISAECAGERMRNIFYKPYNLHAVDEFSAPQRALPMASRITSRNQKRRHPYRPTRCRPLKSTWARTTELPCRPTASNPFRLPSSWISRVSKPARRSGASRSTSRLMTVVFPQPSRPTGCSWQWVAMYS